MSCHKRGPKLLRLMIFHLQRTTNQLICEFWETLCESTYKLVGFPYKLVGFPHIAKDFFWFSIFFHFVPRNEVGQVRGRIHGDAQEGTRGRCIRKKSFLGASPHFRFLVSKGGYKPVVTRITHESGTCSPGFLTIKWDDPSKKGVEML